MAQTRETSVKITTGLIKSYQKGISLSLDALVDTVEEAYAQMDRDGSDEATIVVTIVRNPSVFTDEQTEAFRK